MTIQEITKGFRIYNVSKDDFVWYDYLCPMPVNNPVYEGEYHILIDKRLDKPIRMYKKELERLLEIGLFTLDDTLDKQIELAEDWVKFLKEKRERDNNKLES